MTFQSQSIFYADNTSFEIQEYEGLPCPTRIGGQPQWMIVDKPSDQWPVGALVGPTAYTIWSANKKEVVSWRISRLRDQIGSLEISMKRDALEKEVLEQAIRDIRSKHG